MARWAIVVCMLAAAVAALAQVPTPQEARKLTDKEKAELRERLGLTPAQTQPTTRPATQPATQPADGTTPATTQPADTASTAAETPREELLVRVKLETSLGDIVLELDGQRAPISTRNFVEYAQAGFYNGTIFHRVMSNFMIQGGGFLPDLAEKTDGLKAPIKNEWQNGLKNLRGTIAMARTAAPDSARAQFYINVVDNPGLDAPRGGAAYAVFGKVVEGMDTVDRIRDSEVIEDPRLPMGKVVPKETVLIKSAKVIGAYHADKIEAQAGRAKQAEQAVAERAASERTKPLDDFVARKEAETGRKFATTPTGLKYLVLTEGTGAQPATTDTVTVHYVGTLLDGTEFDSSIRRGEPTSFPLNQVIRGWTEGVSMMKVGEKRILICPPDLAYGPRSPSPKIPPNSTLVFEVELLGIAGK